VHTFLVPCATSEHPLCMHGCQEARTSRVRGIPSGGQRRIECGGGVKDMTTQVESPSRHDSDDTWLHKVAAGLRGALAISSPAGLRFFDPEQLRAAIRAGWSHTGGDRVITGVRCGRCRQALCGLQRRAATF
jgi:hypothetical protein